MLNNSLIASVAFYFFILFYSCSGEKSSEIPENILSKKKMTAVMKDIQILEASIGLNMIKTNDTIKKDTNLFFDIFLLHQTNKNQYDESLLFYVTRPDLLNQIYDSVLVELEKEKIAIDQ